MATTSFPRPIRQACICILWILFWLAVLDVGTGRLMHRIAARNPASSIARYFEYGLSIETKLDRTTRLPVDAPDARILHAGWLDRGPWRDLPAAPQPGADLLVAVYGQSFALNAMYRTAQLDGHVTVRPVGGPAAPPDHSYAAYQLDAPDRRANVVLFGILASSVAHMGAMSGASATFEHPAPFTWPHYSLHDGRLEAVAPVFQTEDAFRSAFAADSDQWRLYKDQLARYDRGFDRVAFDRTWWDRSQIALLLRRGWVAHMQDYNAGVYDARRGFDPAAEQIRVLNAMLVELGRQTRARGERLIVLLEHDQGYGDSLYRAVAGTLNASGIEFISTHALFSANDPHNFIADGHFSHDANDLFARELARIIRSAPPPARQGAAE